MPARSATKMAEWREYPIWVPLDSGHLAAVVTVPSRRPRALVALLPEGGAAPRSHRHRLWTRIARALAERGLASVRFDYPNIGDSTGNALVDWDSPPVEEAMAVVQVGTAVTGVSSIATVGNCLGARTALGVAGRMDACKATVIFVQGEADCLVLGNTQQSAAIADRRLLPPVLRVKLLLRRTVRWVYQRLLARDFGFASEAETIFNSKPCLLLLLGGEVRAQRLERLINDAISVAGAPRGQVETRRVPVSGMGLRLPHHLQSTVIGDVVDWLDRTLPSSASSAPS